MKLEDVTRRHRIGKYIDYKNYKIGLEIGVREGNNSYNLLKSSKLEKLYCVDPWTMTRVRGMTRNSNGNKFMSEAVVKLNEFGDRAIMIRAKSQEVSHLFYDGFFDFIHIDGAHTRPWIDQDIELYWDKCRSGGLFTGHDYSSNPKHAGTVKDAVDEFVKREKLKLYCTNDRLATWMIQK